VEKDCLKLVEEKEVMAKENVGLQEAHRLLTAKVSEMKNAIVQAVDQERFLKDEMKAFEGKMTRL
jgi:hypothetical protein